MSTIFTSEQLKKALSELQKQKEAFGNGRAATLKKYQQKAQASENTTEMDLHNLERKIEDLERKLDALL